MNDLNIRIAKAKNIELKWSKFVIDPALVESHATACSPDYSLPENALKLMDEIWESDPFARITKANANLDGNYRVDDDNMFLPLYGFDAKTLPEAICLAWLEIFEKEEK